MAQDALPKSPPIVLSKRADLISVVKEELKKLGIESSTVLSAQDECIEKLIHSPASVLVVEWELGSEVVNQVLAAIKGHFHVETRPILLVTAEISDTIIAVATEFGVSQVHAGELTNETVRECLEALFKEDKETQVIRDVMVQVAAARSKGDWTIATPLLIQLQAKMPENERVAVELAENLIYENAWDGALKALEPFTTQDPPSVRALHLKGRCLLQMGKAEEAIESLKRAKLINPHNVDRLIDLGNAFLHNDQIDEAKESFGEATALQPENKEAKVGTGQCMLMAGEVNEALTLLKAISGPRELASIFNTSAVLSMHSGHFDKGMSLYKSALTAVGRNDKLQARLMFNMGLGYRRWSKPEKALQCFAKSIELDPTYVKAIKHKEQLEHKHKPSQKSDEKPAEAFGEEEFSQIKPVDQARRQLPADQPLHDTMDTEGFDVDDDESK